MPIPIVRRSLFNGLVKDNRFSDVPGYVSHIYCNCQSGVDHKIVMLTDGEMYTTSYGSWHCYNATYRHIVELAVNPVVTDNPYKMVVKVV